jgi:hypothetical protein
MNVTELTKKIYNEYPEVWGEIEDNLNNILDMAMLTISFDNEEIWLGDAEYNYLDKIPFPMLYGLLEDFFEENGIIIEIKYFASMKDWRYQIKQLYKSDWFYKIIEKYPERCNSKQEAKEQAILKASEILEDKLK